MEGPASHVYNEQLVKELDRSDAHKPMRLRTVPGRLNVAQCGR